MEIETYRYLMSALIQVFGALIALEGIFILFRRERLYKDKDSILFSLGRIYSIIDINRLDLHSISPNDKIHSKDAIDNASYFKYMPSDEIETRINNIKIILSEYFDREKSKINWEDIFEGVANDYYGKIEEIKSSAKDAIKMMGTPAILCLLFAFGLLVSDNLGCFRFQVALIYMILSTISFSLLIYWAKQILSEERA